MKNLSILFLFGLISLTVNAQKIIEKTIQHKDRFIELDVKFARNIEVKTWEKSTVYLKANIEIKESQFIDKYQLDINETKNNISIVEKAEPVFEAIQDYGKKNDPDNLRYWYNSGDLCKFNYVLYVPKDAKFKISSINGDLKSEAIEGEFTADLINGDIDIKKYAGNLDLSTINGEIDLKMINADLIAETIHGDIYADEKLKFDSTDRHVGQKISGRVADGKNRLRLNTINGNMYLRL